MDIVIASLGFVVAAFCAATMGFAIQRGGTCTVAAVQEIVTERRASRLAALVEASLWVGGGLLVAQAFQLLPNMPRGYAASGWTVLGGALLGLGAFVNGACVMGAIGRFGSGEWVYLLTPVGFFIGCSSVDLVFAMAPAARLTADSRLLAASLWGVLLFAAFAAWRLARPLLAARRYRGAAPLQERLRHGVARHVWSPHAATCVIGITFVVLFLTVGAWSYTDVISDAARGMAGNLAARVALLVVLLAGAVVGGVTAGRFRHTRVTLAPGLRCLGGGVLMGWGSLLVPGGNDVLVLMGMPLLWPYAWLAFATMCIVIAASMLVRLRLGAPAEEGAT